MTILVAGGSGFIGSEIIKMLSESEKEPICYDKIPANSNLKNGKWVTGDILDSSSVGRVLAENQIDTVLHLVGLPVVETCEKNPDLSFLLNVASVQKTLEAMRLSDVKKIVFASSASVYGILQQDPIKEVDPASPNTIYGYHKLIAEQVVKSYSKSYGIEYVIFRLFNVYGADPNFGKDVLSIFVRKALAGEPLIVKGSEKFRDFVNVNDVAQAFVKACKHGQDSNLNALINIGSGARTSLGSVARIVKKHCPEIEVREESAPDDGTGLQADISLARNLLDFKPTPPEKGISDHIAKYLKVPENC